jgi:ATP-dependent RNA helicase TDRD9
MPNNTVLEYVLQKPMVGTDLKKKCYLFLFIKVEESARRLLNISDVESVVSGLSNRSEVPYVLQIPAPRLPELHENELPVSVCHVEEPNHFWCHRLDSRSKRDYKHLTGLVGPQGSRLERWDIKVPVVKGNLVMGPFKAANNYVEYYRAKVLSTQQGVPIHEQRVRLYFIDFGNAAEAHVKDLKVVSDGLLKFPPLAIECYLTGVGPSFINDPKGKWTKSGKEWFELQTVDQILTARVSRVPIIILNNRIHLIAKVRPLCMHRTFLTKFE